ncbi:probable beta-D-xylosidase 5 [Eucalyptus grandis]|uniref:probable beta-D-xylosidase 5 n=1 Tax=Eucalyptus grandis TaxID=71139 RepID=UPI00192EBA14|nr:probable beta-D-xylosidase 5 [Eucalyptus grandis]
MSSFSFCDASLTYEERAKDLVKRMVLHEKVRQLGNGAYGVPRLGLPKYEWWSEALHGVSNVGPGTFFDHFVPGATSFPTVILMAAAFNESLWKSIGQAVSTEARAMYNLRRAGLTFWSPNINVVRDPRWGRALETPGEDPFVVGRYAVNYVRGLQDVEGADPRRTADPNQRPLKVSSCCKHYAAYDVDDWLGVDRFHFDARVRQQDMEETFLRPFEMCVKDGDVSSVMCSYNRVDGIPTCADPNLLKDTIRGEWDLHGYIVSDCDSIQVMVDYHKFLGDTNEDAVARTLKAGLDLDCGVYYTNFTAGAVAEGKVREREIDTSLKYLYIVLMRLGFFDGSPEFKSLGKDDICTKANLELAARAAEEGIVLLKNNRTLPLSPHQARNIAVVGPHANATEAMIGNYAGVPCRYTAPIDGFSRYGVVTYKEGCADIACKNESFIFPAMKAAKRADATVILAGLDLSVEAEGLDRTDLVLPGYQTQLINQVAEVAKGPVVLVILSAGGVDISFAKENPNIGGILWAGYPGEEGGRAIADVVFGHYNPGGRLPLTWHKADYVDMLPMTSMPLRPVPSLGYPGRTYKFFNGSIVYPFGYGLSYTRFNYSLSTAKRFVDLKVENLDYCRDLSYNHNTKRPPCPATSIDDLDCRHDIDFVVEVMNTGHRDGSDVVLVYSKPPHGILGTHIKQLIGFERVFVRKQSSQKVHFKINVCKGLEIVDYAANHVLPSGGHSIVIGDDVVSFPFQVNFS